MVTNQDREAVSEIEGSEGIKTQEMLLNMGPQHPSTHGVLRLVMTLEGETRWRDGGIRKIWRRP